MSEINFESDIMEVISEVEKISEKYDSDGIMRIGDWYEVALISISYLREENLEEDEEEILYEILSVAVENLK